MSSCPLQAMSYVTLETRTPALNATMRTWVIRQATNMSIVGKLAIECNHIQVMLSLKCNKYTAQLAASTRRFRQSRRQPRLPCKRCRLDQDFTQYIEKLESVTRQAIVQLSTTVGGMNPARPHMPKPQNIWCNSIVYRSCAGLYHQHQV